MLWTLVAVLLLIVLAPMAAGIVIVALPWLLMGAVALGLIAFAILEPEAFFTISGLLVGMLLVATAPVFVWKVTATQRSAFGAWVAREMLGPHADRRLTTALIVLVVAALSAIALLSRAPSTP